MTLAIIIAIPIAVTFLVLAMFAVGARSEDAEKLSQEKIYKEGE